jgi:hypothetical protein
MHIEPSASIYAYTKYQYLSHMYKCPSISSINSS